MKKLTKVIAFLLSVTSCWSIAACGGNSLEDEAKKNTTVLYVQNDAGGIGGTWLTNAFARFAEAKKDEEYQPGKKGVSIKVTTSFDVWGSLDTDNTYMYFSLNTPTIKSVARQGKVMDLTDVLTADSPEGKIIDKIDAKFLTSCEYEGKYYGLPHCEIFPGIIYDIELFEKYSLYISATSDGAEGHEAFGKTCYFTSGLEGKPKKSCGNDGKFGTEDDGLPSSLMEFLVMCDKANINCTPLIVAGNHADYTNYTMTGLITALSGADAMEANYDFDGQIEYVTGYTNEPLFPDVNDLLKIEQYRPETETITVTQENAYLCRRQVARYYATAIMEIMEKSGWVYSSANENHAAVQEKFIYGINGTTKKNRIAMICEASHVYNEFNDNGIMDRFYIDTGRNAETSERRVGFMYLPTQVYDSVQPKADNEEANEYAIHGSSSSYMIINANIKDEGIIRACKDFLKFLFTNDEINQFTYTTGVTRPGLSVDNTKDGFAKLSSYQKSVVNMVMANNVKIVRPVSDNPVFYNNSKKFVPSISSETYKMTYNNVAYDCCWEAFRNKSLASVVTARNYFEGAWISPNEWITLCNG